MDDQQPLPTNSDPETNGASNFEGASRPRREPRTDKGKLHRRRNGLLSKHPLQALARRGENIREICKQERSLSQLLQPPGPLGKILFDRFWSSFLRCLLIDCVEAELLGSGQRQGVTVREIPRLLIEKMPTLAYGSIDDRDNADAEVVKYLALTQRYDAHYSGEFYRTLGLLLALKNGGTTGLTEALLQM
jgi:hypothetical protein